MKKSVSKELKYKEGAEGTQRGKQVLPEPQNGILEKGEQMPGISGDDGQIQGHGATLASLEGYSFFGLGKAM